MADSFDPKLIDPQTIIRDASGTPVPGAIKSLESRASGPLDARAMEAVRKEADTWETDIRDEQIKNIRAARHQRNIYAGCTYFVVLLWIALIGSIMIGQQHAQHFGVTPLSDNVMIAFLTTSTATIIAMFVIVLKYIFHLPDPPTR